MPAQRFTRDVLTRWNNENEHKLTLDDINEIAERMSIACKKAGRHPRKQISDEEKFKRVLKAFSEHNNRLRKSEVQVLWGAHYSLMGFRTFLKIKGYAIRTEHEIHFHRLISYWVLEKATR